MESLSKLGPQTICTFSLWVCPTWLGWEWFSPPVSITPFTPVLIINSLFFATVPQQSTVQHIPGIWQELWMEISIQSKEGVSTQLFGWSVWGGVIPLGRPTLLSIISLFFWCLSSPRDESLNMYPAESVSRNCPWTCSGKILVLMWGFSPCEHSSAKQLNSG